MKGVRRARTSVPDLYAGATPGRHAIPPASAIIRELCYNFALTYLARIILAAV